MFVLPFVYFSSTTQMREKERMWAILQIKLTTPAYVHLLSCFTVFLFFLARAPLSFKADPVETLPEHKLYIKKGSAVVR